MFGAKLESSCSVLISSESSACTLEVLSTIYSEAFVIVQALFAAMGWLAGEAYPPTHQQIEPQPIITI